MDILHVFNRLKIWQKLTLVALALTVPLFITMFYLIQENNKSINFAEAEYQGSAYMRPVSRLFSHVVERRTLSRRYHSGDLVVKPALDKVTGYIESELKALFEIDKRLGEMLLTHKQGLRDWNMPESAEPSEIGKTWETVKRASGSKSDELHNKLATDVKNLFLQIGNSSNLILDPDMDAYYLMDSLLMRLIEIVDRVRLANDSIDDMLRSKVVGFKERTDLLSNLALLKFHTETLKLDFDTYIWFAPKISGRQEDLKKVMTGPLNDTVLRVGKLYDDALTQIVLAPALTNARPEHFTSLVEQTIDASERYWSASFDQLDAMLRVRQGKDLSRRYNYLQIVFFALAIGGLLAVGVMRSISKPIKKASAVADQLARGELPDKIEVGNGTDETTHLLRSINGMLQFLDLRNTMKTLQNSVTTMSEAVRNLEHETDEQHHAVSRQAAALQETQVTAQEIKQTSALAAQKADTVLQYAERAEAVSRSGEAAVEQSLGALVEIRDQVGEIAERINKLNERTVQIADITQTVKDLADQSNMLALNAAIEAVRSGEHGKGFAVVAREIRNLADQSIQATNRVREILDDITRSVQAAVTITESGSKRIDAGLVQMKTSGEKIKDLSGIVKENLSTVRQIAAAVGQQNAGISQIFSAVIDQNKMMDDTVRRLDTTKQAALTVRNVSGTVADVVKRFRV